MTDFIPPRRGSRRTPSAERPLSRHVTSLFEPSTTAVKPRMPTIGQNRTRHSELLGLTTEELTATAPAQEGFIQRNETPEQPGSWNLEPYAICTHQCSYCHATQVAPDWTQVFANNITPAPAIEIVRELEAWLMRRTWHGQTLLLSGLSDPYQPRERSFRLTAQCLRVLNQFHNPTTIMTKNSLIVRDLEILEEMADRRQVHVIISMASLDRDRTRELEPGTAGPDTRLSTIAKLADRGIPVMVQVAPVLPGFNDHEIPQILALAAEAGAKAAVMHPLRLPPLAQQEFYEWLEHDSRLPTKRVRQLMALARRHAKMGASLGQGRQVPVDDHSNTLKTFDLCIEAYGLKRSLPRLDRSSFRRTPGGWHQPSIFDTTSPYEI